MSDITLENLDTAEKAIEGRLDTYGALHSIKTAETAQMIATLYCVDSTDAYLAGLLHDWDRVDSRENLIAKAKRYDLELDEIILQYPQLLHAHTGAIDARKHFLTLAEETQRFDIGDHVFHAIYNHTVGDTEMSDLDKVVYIADMIEPTRSFPAIDSLREAVGTVGLDSLFVLAYSRTLMHLASNRKALHPRTVEVWNSLMLNEHS